eukprot:15335494-Ditylum_brightwellii.AAC.1
MPYHINAVHKQGYFLPEDVEKLQNETGMVIDNNNKPAPENVPVIGETEILGELVSHKQNSSNFCQ